MIKIRIEEKMLEWARGRANKHVKGARYDKDVDNRDSIYIGYVGEAIWWAKHQDATHVNRSGYDFEFLGEKVEIKTNWTKCFPKDEHLLKVPVQDYERTHPEAVFCFICVNTEANYAWELGYINKSTFDEKCQRRKKGDKQQGSKFIYTTDCFEIIVSDLSYFLVEPDHTEWWESYDRAVVTL